MQPESPEFFKNIPAGELEKGNFKHMVVEILGKKFGRFDLAMNLEDGKININLETETSATMTNIAEKYSENNGTDFDSTDVMLVRAETLAKKLAEQYPEKE